MEPHNRFTFLRKDEPEKKSFKWTLTEDRILPLEEVNRLRHMGRKMMEAGIRHRKFFQVRDWFMIELGLFTGLRVSEMCDLELRDLLIDEGYSSVVVRNGKGGKKRNVWISLKFRNICRDFLKLRKHLGLPNEGNNPLLSSCSGERLSKRALQKAFKRCLHNAGIKFNYGIHSLRHTYATFLLKSGHNLKLVQKQLGHSSIKVTEIYISLLKDDTEKALDGLYRNKT